MYKINQLVIGLDSLEIEVKVSILCDSVGLK